MQKTDDNTVPVSDWSVRSPAVLQRRRVVLVIASVSFIALYGFTIFVALMTSGRGLLASPLVWGTGYAALAPLIFCSYCILTAALVDRIPKVSLVVSGIALGAAVAPAVWYSFLCEGVLLLPVAYLWVRLIVSLPRRA